jgi:hypothetical protein
MPRLAHRPQQRVDLTRANVDPSARIELLLGGQESLLVSGKSSLCSRPRRPSTSMIVAGGIFGQVIPIFFFLVVVCESFFYNIITGRNSISISIIIIIVSPAASIALVCQLRS